MTEHVFQLAGAKRRIDRDERDAGEPRRELAGPPARGYCWPDRHALAWREAASSHAPPARTAPTARHIVQTGAPRHRRAGHQRNRLGVRAAAARKSPPTHEIQNRPRPIRGPLRSREHAPAARPHRHLATGSDPTPAPPQQQPQAARADTIAAAIDAPGRRRIGQRASWHAAIVRPRFPFHLVPAA